MAGMVTVSHQASGDTRSFTADGGPIAIECVKQHVVLLRAQHHKCAAVGQGVEVPKVSLIVSTQPVQPTKNVRFNQRPFGHLTKVFRPEMDALRIRNLGGGESVCFGIAVLVHGKNPFVISG